MTNPGPLGGDERPDGDPIAVGEVSPSAVPPAPAYEPSELIDATPAYDSLAQESGLDGPTDSLPEFGALSDEPLGTEDADLAAPADYALAPNPGEGGPLGAVKALAGKNPAAFIGAALAIGWLLGKIFSSSDDDES